MRTIKALILGLLITLMASCTTEENNISPNLDLDNNMGFESGNFENWDTIGNTAIADKDFGASPVEGEYQAFITTLPAEVTNNDSEAVTPNELAIFSNITIDELNSLNSVETLVTEGSAIKTSFTAYEGDKVVISWNFLSSETAGGEGGMNDFAYYVLDSPGMLIDYTTSIFIGSDSLFQDQTGFKETTLNIEADGEHTLTIGITNVFDTRFGSGLLIDNFRIVTN